MLDLNCNDSGGCGNKLYNFYMLTLKIKRLTIVLKLLVAKYRFGEMILLTNQ